METSAGAAEPSAALPLDFLSPFLTESLDDSAIIFWRERERWDTGANIRLMIPRFENPHFRPLQIQAVPRAQLFDAEDSEEPDVELQKMLDELIQANLDADISGRVKKKRKLNAAPAVETSVVFRLLSTPHPISLLPRPPPPPITREPECEDTPIEAETRRRQAEAVAVDAAWVMQESARVPPAFRAGRVRRVQAPPEFASMMIAHCLQSPRKTRPPVPRSQLAHYPYVAAPILPSRDAKGAIPSVEVAEVPNTPRKTRKRRRGKGGDQVRPQATFWWPAAGCGGKSLGYGMGHGSQL
ncbi:hypothetical protein B0H17DRAFT_337095 [Mycena rosella]|uniref:Uncharacterized protein n=1 Tax=Mycena rosella TaxID=1033263 RepID=A0AAD7CRV4_MYCRO|nr:hypothetical protein B0H17DRAFT_337095 [Mycena rosella]